MMKAEATLKAVKSQVEKQVEFWARLSVIFDQVDLSNIETVKQLDETLAPHIDGWGYIQGEQVKAPLAWIEGLLNDWPAFCQACREEISECKCEGNNE